MKLFASITLLVMLCHGVSGEDPEYVEAISRHQSGARDLSDSQDELAADVQQLTIEQTDEEVIKLFREVESLMDEASERLFELDTGGDTLAAQTEIIEKIFDAAEKKQQQSGGQGSGQPGSAMMDMLQRMMGREVGGKPGEGQSGMGQTGESQTDNERVAGQTQGNVIERRVPKGSGTAGKSLPSEFQNALKAYNRGLAPIEPSR